MSRWLVFFLLYLLAFFSLSFWIQFTELGAFFSRDLERAISLLEAFSPLGPEINGGGFTIGPLYHYLFLIPHLFGADWDGYNYFRLGLYAFCPVILFYIGKRIQTELYGYVLFGLGLSFHFFIHQLTADYSASYAIPLLYLWFLFLFLYLDSPPPKTQRYWCISWVTLALSTQIHFMFLSLVPIQILAQTLKVHPFSLRTAGKDWALGVLCFLMPTLPFLSWVLFPGLYPHLPPFQMSYYESGVRWQLVLEKSDEFLLGIHRWIQSLDEFNRIFTQPYFLTLLLFCLLAMAISLFKSKGQIRRQFSQSPLWQHPFPRLIAFVCPVYAFCSVSFSFATRYMSVPYLLIGFTLSTTIFHFCQTLSLRAYLSTLILACLPLAIWLGQVNEILLGSLALILIRAILFAPTPRAKALVLGLGAALVLASQYYQSRVAMVGANFGKHKAERRFLKANFMFDILTEIKRETGWSCQEISDRTLRLNLWVASYFVEACEARFGKLPSANGISKSPWQGILLFINYRHIDSDDATVFQYGRGLPLTPREVKNALSEEGHYNFKIIRSGDLVAALYSVSDPLRLPEKLGNYGYPYRASPGDELLDRFPRSSARPDQPNFPEPGWVFWDYCSYPSQEMCRFGFYASIYSIKKDVYQIRLEALGAPLSQSDFMLHSMFTVALEDVRLEVDCGGKIQSFHFADLISDDGAYLQRFSDKPITGFYAAPVARRYWLECSSKPKFGEISISRLYFVYHMLTRSESTGWKVPVVFKEQ